MSAVRFNVAVWWQTTARTSLISPRPRVSQPGTSMTSRLVLPATLARSVRYGIVPPSGIPVSAGRQRRAARRRAVRGGAARRRRRDAVAPGDGLRLRRW